VPFCSALFEGESAVRIIFSLSDDRVPPLQHPAQLKSARLAQSLTSGRRSGGGEEMRAIRKTILTTFLLALVTGAMATSGMAQFGTNDATIRDVVRRIQTRTDSLQRAVQNAADRNNYRVDEINRLILDFESAAIQLDRRL